MASPRGAVNHPEFLSLFGSLAEWLTACVAAELFLRPSLSCLAAGRISNGTPASETEQDRNLVRDVGEQGLQRELRRVNSATQPGFMLRHLVLCRALWPYLGM